MFRLLARRKHRAAPVRRQGLRLQSLEARDCPAVPPILLTFNVNRLQGLAIQVSGIVLDDNPATAQVRLSGVAGGIFNVNALGAFSGFTNATGFGQITGQAFDSEGYISKPRDYNYQNLAPSFSYQVQQSGPGQFRVFGTVTDEYPQLTTVHLGGIHSGSTTPSSNGNFSYTFSSSSLGGMTIRAVDSIGQGTPLFNFQLVNQAPVIAPFTAERNGNAWIFRGTVSDEFPTGLVVTFQSSIPSIDGRTATVMSDGSFSMVAYLKFGETGVVSASTADWFGIASNTAYVFVG